MSSPPFLTTHQEYNTTQYHLPSLTQHRNILAMARSFLPNEPSVEEDYIDMDISSATLFCYTIPSPPHPRDFEFQMSLKSLDNDHINSPADELFYKGKLLPLHLPPRLELVQKLLQDPTPTHHGKPDHRFDDSVSIANTNTNTNTAATTPYESCNISPATSCYVSGELNPEDYFSECQKAVIPIHNKKSWSKKLKLIKTSSLGIKIRASKAYIKSLFTKSGCSDESCAVPKAKECSTGSTKEGQNSPHGQIQRADSMLGRIDGEKKMVEEVRGHRRSFSEAIKRRSSNKSSSASSSCSSSDSSNSSSFSSVNSNGLYGPQVLKRSSSVNSEVECSIQGAIAYCKKSQQEVHGRKSVSDVEFYTLSASRIAVDCEKQERPEIGLEAKEAATTTSLMLLSTEQRHQAYNKASFSPLTISVAVLGYNGHRCISCVQNFRKARYKYKERKISIFTPASLRFALNYLRIQVSAYNILLLKVSRITSGEIQYR